MKYNLITPATALPISVLDAKSHLRVTSSDHDALIEDLIWGAARQFENRTNTVLSPQTWDLVLDSDEVKERIEFLKYPILGITSLKYYDTDNVLQTLTGGSSNRDYISFINGRPAAVDFVVDETPSTYDRVDAMTIRFLAGYSTLPYDIKHALLAWIFRMYENPNDPVSMKVSFFDKIVNDYRGYGF
jgi:uncharacterized phiE125 gp8 family phage protein